MPYHLCLHLSGPKSAETCGERRKGGRLRAGTEGKADYNPRVLEALFVRRLDILPHRAHHLSAGPTPWADYAFSVPEAFIQAGIGPGIVFAIPAHPLAFAAFVPWQITFNVLEHCGHEIFPRWFVRSWAGRVLNSVTHHALHHERFGAKFGLYFNVWDRLMRTNHPDYQARFDLAAGGAGSQHHDERRTPSPTEGRASGGFTDHGGPRHYSSTNQVPNQPRTA